LVAARFAAGQDFREKRQMPLRGTDIQQLKISQGTLGCRARNTDGNVRVNQDCTFRRQAEELIKIIRPTRATSLLARTTAGLATTSAASTTA